jgi:hypothetical protein
MATIVTRAGKGSPLTHEEVDANFTNLNSDKVETSTISAFGASLIDDADASAARTTLGLGDAATTASTDYATAAQGAKADTSVQRTSSTGAAIIPSGTEAERPTPATGHLRFNTDATSFEGYNGTEWGAIGGGGGATSDAVYENSATIAENITIVTGRNGMSTGPITVNSGVTVTVESGARYVVI